MVSNFEKNKNILKISPLGNRAKIKEYIFEKTKN